jgi:transcriptional regulator with XRE-family HTH domain
VFDRLYFLPVITAAMKAQLSSRFRIWRVDAGLTQEEVADLTGYSVAMISRVERGERQLRPEAKVRLSRRLGVRVADLFEPDPISYEE